MIRPVNKGRCNCFWLTTQIIPLELLDASVSKEVIRQCFVKVFRKGLNNRFFCKAKQTPFRVCVVNNVLLVNVFWNIRHNFRTKTDKITRSKWWNTSCEHYLECVIYCMLTWLQIPILASDHLPKLDKSPGNVFGHLLECNKINVKLQL